MGLPGNKLALFVVCHIENSQGFIQNFYWGEGGMEIRAKRAGMHQCQNYNLHEMSQPVLLAYAHFHTNLEL